MGRPSMMRGDGGVGDARGGGAHQNLRLRDTRACTVSAMAVLHLHRARRER